MVKERGFPEDNGSNHGPARRDYRGRAGHGHGTEHL